MPYITFYARKQFVASYRLDGRAVLGRSLDADVFIPDVFVSRRHCRFEPTPGGGWAVVDLGSVNGIHVDGRKVGRHVMRQDEVVEVGSVAVVYDEGDLPAGISRPAPFGAGAPLSELVDTVFAGGLRPADYARTKFRREAWEAKAQTLVFEEEDEQTAAAREAAERARRIEEDWTGLLKLELPESRVRVGFSKMMTAPEAPAPTPALANSSLVAAPVTPPPAVKATVPGSRSSSPFGQQRDFAKEAGTATAKPAKKKAKPASSPAVRVDWMDAISDKIAKIRSVDTSAVLTYLRDKPAVAVAAAALLLAGGVWMSWTGPHYRPPKTAVTALDTYNATHD